MAKLGEGTELLKCSFCGKSQKQVKKLIAGPGVYICDECIDLCNEIIEEELSEPADATLGDLASPPGDLRLLGRLHSGPVQRQANPVGGGLQPLQAGAARLRHRPRRRAPEVEHPAHRPHRLRQDAHGPDPGPDAQRALRHRRRHRPHRGGLRGRGRGEHPPQAHPGRRLRRQEGRDRHHLHRRDRQDRSPRARTPRSPGTCPARGFSRRC